MSTNRIESIVRNLRTRWANKDLERDPFVVSEGTRAATDPTLM